MDYVFLTLGLLGLFAGGEALVRGAVGIAQRLAMSSLLIGLTVVGFGTSTPELLVSVDAAWRGVPDIAIGNVVGSNIGNILLIVGLSALVWPIRVSGGTLKRTGASIRTIKLPADALTRTDIHVGHGSCSAQARSGMSLGTLVIEVDAQSGIIIPPLSTEGKHSSTLSTSASTTQWFRQHSRGS